MTAVMGGGHDCGHLPGRRRQCNLSPSFSAGDSIVKNWFIVVVGSVLAVVVSTHTFSHPTASATVHPASRCATTPPADTLALKLYFGLMAFERSTNSVVRHALSSLTGQPGIGLKAHSE